MWILLTVLAVLLIYLWVRYVKAIRCGNMICVTGGIKTGKTALCVRQALQLVASQRHKVWFYNHIGRYVVWLFKHKLPQERERPLLYSNIPLSVPYVPITRDLLRREERPVYGSVCYICEASLVADSMTYKDTLLNEQLQLFNKLWAHASKGGYLIYDTQSISDNHYTVKRCLNSYFYIHHTVKVPFFLIMFLREERYSEDGQTVNTVQGDLESEQGQEPAFKIHVVPKSVFRVYDRYCYSVLTDDKRTTEEVPAAKDLKARDIITLKNYHTLRRDEK